MTWLLVKVFLGKASDWIVAHWQLVLFALMAFAIWHYQSDYKAAVKELADYKQEATDASNKQIAELAIKKVTAQSVVDTAVSFAALDMTRFNLDRTQSTNDIKKLYETKISSVKHNLALRTGSLQPTSSDPSNTTEATSDTQELAGAGQECDAAIARSEANYKILEDACTITTSDFNVCRVVIDADTLMYGREDSTVKQ